VSCDAHSALVPTQFVHVPPVYIWGFVPQSLLCDRSSVITQCKHSLPYVLYDIPPSPFARIYYVSILSWFLEPLTALHRRFLRQFRCPLLFRTSSNLSQFEFWCPLIIFYPFTSDNGWYVFPWPLHARTTLGPTERRDGSSYSPPLISVVLFVFFSPGSSSKVLRIAQLPFVRTNTCTRGRFPLTSTPSFSYYLYHTPSLKSAVGGSRM